jgi:hypothetical protein
LTNRCLPPASKALPKHLRQWFETKKRDAKRHRHRVVAS